MKRSSATQVAAPVQLTWSHFGRLHRVSAWPEVEFTVEQDGGWVAYEPDPSSAEFIAGVVMLDAAKWQRYLEFLPAAERAFVSSFKFGRLAALAVITRCPALLAELSETPALLPLVAAHVQLRGAAAPRWSELAAVHDRAGVFGVLEWLGLPASRSTLAILGRVADPDLPRRLLAPIRAALWQPAAVLRFERRAVLSENTLLRDCSALAA
ncbi:hypothetical protein K0B96_00975 [Horticoccus luteus]|uniref:Uncharacterized protein n=1 Tax=Horticoccus luteus TaxID=2862869 RepID=A0A8F9TWQ2_9BACT|nr:hypothetical protein [Horticoccus luteus]QYM79219.1 hypothetical protein K0B96_00975 [Horticoccus luteus]